MPGKPTRPFHIQERDCAVLLDLLHSRVLTLRHVALLHFGGRYEAAKKRMATLRAASVVAAHPRTLFTPALLHITKTGLSLLHKRRMIAFRPDVGAKVLKARFVIPPTAIRHELAVLDTKAAFCHALSASGTAQVLEFTTWPLLNQFIVHREVVKPDGFVRYRITTTTGITGDGCCFLEMDLSTEPQTTLVKRALQYVAYAKSGAFAALQERSYHDAKGYPFRVLFVMENESRRNNTIERLLDQRPPVLALIWLTTLSALKRDPLGEIWIRPADYRSAINGTPFASRNGSSSRMYRRDVARDTFVERHVARRRLL